MRTNLPFLSILLVIVGLGNQPAYTLGAAFTYQGQLKEAGIPVTASADFRFTLFSAPIGRNQVGEGITVNGADIHEGLFTVQLDFGTNVFSGADRWMAIEVRIPSSEGIFTLLNPRQPLTAVPYSIQTRGIFVNEEERVGIGTYSPVLDLQVSGTFNATAGVKSRQAVIGEGVYNQWLYFRSGTGLVGTHIKRHSSNDLAIGSEPEIGGAFKEDLRITKEGNVGIGVTNPTAILEVRSANQEPAIEVDGNGSSGTAIAVQSGAIRAPGGSTETPVFIHVATGSNIRNCDSMGMSCEETIIDHPMTNNDPSAILFVMPNEDTGSVSAAVENVFYDTDLNKWVIDCFLDNYYWLGHGQKFNVLVFKQ